MGLAILIGGIWVVGVLGGREMGILSCGAMSCQVLFRVKCVQMTDLHVLILRDCRDFFDDHMFCFSDSWQLSFIHVLSLVIF